MWSVLSNPLKVVGLVLVLGSSLACSADASASISSSDTQIDDLPLVALSQELQDCMPEVNSIRDPFWVPEAAQASTSGYGYVETLQAGLPTIRDISSGCESSRERAETLIVANAQVFGGEAFREANKAWAQCMAAKGFSSMQGVVDRHGQLWSQTASSEVMSESQYFEKLSSAKQFEIRLAEADRDCFAEEIETRLTSLAAEQQALIDALPDDSLARLKGSQ